MLPRHARCVLSRLRCNGHSLLLGLIFLGLAESRILPAVPADTRPRTPLISFCTVQRRTLRRSIFGDSLSLYDLWFRSWEVARLLGRSWSPAMPPSLGRGRVTKTTTWLSVAVLGFQQLFTRDVARLSRVLGDCITSFICAFVMQKKSVYDRFQAFVTGTYILISDRSKEKTIW